MNFPRARKIFSALFALSLLVTLGAGCGGGDTSEKTEEKVKLTYWRVFDGDDAFDEIISAYEAQHPYVSIDYRVLRFADYEEELLRALAKGEGPDLFTVHNTQMREYQDFLLPMPATVDVKFLETVGSLRKETVLTKKTVSMPSLRSVREDFVDVVAQDVVLPYQASEKAPEEDRVFGLPFSVDTLGLYYDKDLFNAAGIAEAPATWDAFHDAVKALTRYADDGTITQSAVALGTTKNVDRAADIVQALMLQNGTVMVDDRGRIAFNGVPDEVGEGIFPGLDAVRFFTDFANPVKDTYTWTADLPFSLDAFTSGKTAMLLGYSYHLPILRAAAPAKNIGIASFPQIGADAKKVHFANYWVESVSKDTEYPNEAWDFLAFATSAEQVPAYLREAQKPTALRALIATQVEDPVLSPFVGQVLTAQSWYHGYDAAAMENAFLTLADEVLSGNRKAEEAINVAAQVVAQTYTE